VEGRFGFWFFFGPTQAARHSFGNFHPHAEVFAGLQRLSRVIALVSRDRFDHRITADEHEVALPLHDARASVWLSVPVPCTRPH
jgi:hypothetical protein